MSNRTGIIRSGAFAVLALFASALQAADEASLAREILKESGVPGGLVVHLGCGEGKLTAALHQNGRFLVHGLTNSRHSAEAARKTIRSKGLYGTVSVDTQRFGRLPYGDNFVNLVVVDQLSNCLEEGLTLREIYRVLAPGGAAVVGSTSGQKGKLDKQQLSSLLSKSGIKDAKLIKANGLWARFEKPVHVSKEAWTLGTHYANGNKVYPDDSGPFPLMNWINGLRKPGSGGSFALKAACAGGRNFYVFKSAGKTHLVARDAFNGTVLWDVMIGGSAFAAIGDRVYTHIGSLKALDAATGKVIQDYKTSTHSVLVDHKGSHLILGGSRDPVRCLSVSDGKLIWKSPYPVYKTYPIESQGRVLFRSSIKRERLLICLDSKSGKKLWQLPCKGDIKQLSGEEQVIVVLWYSSLTAFHGSDGRKLWSKPLKERSRHPKARWCVSIVNGLVWLQQGTGATWVGYDLMSGEQKKELAYAKKMQPRCSPAQATSRYFIDASNSLLEISSGKLDYIPATRSGCKYGWLIGNGMAFSVPKNPYGGICGCYPMLNGFMGFAPASSKRDTKSSPQRLKGPAYGKVTLNKAEGGWRSPLHDSAGSNASPEPFGNSLKLIWSQGTGAPAGGPVVAEGLAVVPVPDRHTVNAYDSDSGKLKWQFTAGARMGTPTLYQGLVLVPSLDGCVYCLRATDGELVWRLRAAKEARWIGAYEQLEAAMPIQPGVLIREGKLLFAAGRTNELDEGLIVLEADPLSGRLLWKKAFFKHSFHGGVKTQSSGVVLGAPAATANGQFYMRALKIDLKTKKHEVNWRGRAWHGFSRSAASGSAGKFSLYSIKPKRPKDAKRTYGLKGTPAVGKPWSIPFERPMTCLVSAGDKVIAAGPDGDAQKGIILIFNAGDGKKMGEISIPARPLPVGMAVAGGRLFVSTADEKLLCLAE